MKNYTKTHLSLFILLIASTSFAQETVSFEEITTSIKNYYFASSDVGDFDDDGDLDIMYVEVPILQTRVGQQKLAVNFIEMITVFTRLFQVLV